MANTTNFGWTKPSVGDPGWGVTLNTLFDAIDADLAVAHAADGTLKDGAVDNAAALAANVVTEAKIADNAVTTNKIADDAVTSAKISGGYIFVVSDKDSDGTMHPLESASWAGEEKYPDANGETINWNTAFGVPTTAKAVVVNVLIAGVAGSSVVLSATSASAHICSKTLIAEGDTEAEDQVIVPVSSAGTSFIRVAGVTSVSVFLSVTGYFI